jgi:hypothetical protein
MWAKFFKKSAYQVRPGKKELFALKVIILSAFMSLACTTRVSEWVLLNTLPETYSLVYFHNGSLSETSKKQNDALKASYGQGNISISDISKEDIKQPYYALYYRKRLVANYSNPGELKTLTRSPLREKIYKELMDGRLCVMVYLATDNKPKDDKGLQILKNTINSSPFRDIIAVYELSRNSADEAHFATLLLNVEDDLKNINEPMLFGIFGRFKALEPLLAGGISVENINYMIDYLTAECSCLIKDDLPGTDILFSGNWENPEPALLNKIIDENPLLAR